MRNFLGPFFMAGSRAAIITAAVLVAPADAQTRPGSAQKPAPASYTKTWIAPRTADGQPDLQGVWVNATLTPFERPAQLAGRATITDKEATEFERRAAANRVDRPPQAGDPGSYNQSWSDGGSTWLPTRQTSLVVDPPDGRVPVKPAAEAARKYDLEHVADSWEYQSTWERCITRGVPAGMFPAGYNNAYQIVQTPGYVVIHSEMIHEVRVIPTDGRPHLPRNMRQWNGDSVGHWEGATLVVDTTNYSGQGDIATSAATGRIKGIHESQALHVVERFQRTDAETIGYEVTINDPEIYSAPWKVSMPLTRDPDYTLYEYACHEGNLAMEDVLRGGRAKDEESTRK
ncbi:MAG TPA: hypothetical protein VGR73_05305 [Bryobacteraceae bacterium]|nr:hypothetical protein [Bryobacteraceae bacterium]